MEDSKSKKVISKNIKGSSKTLNKKDNIILKLINTLKKHKKISIGIFSLLLIIISVIIVINNISLNYKVVTINNYDYYENDFMIYLYSAKYNYFGSSNVSEDDLNVIYDADSNMKIKDYLKEVALNDLKTSTAIKLMASDNNIVLDDSDYKEIEEEKKEFIKSLGSYKDFKKFLKKNNTTEESYDNMSKTDKLYKKMLKKLYSNGKVNDLTDEEYTNAKSDYLNNYYKIKQVILTTIDINSGKKLSSTAINQKETLANSIVVEAKNGVEFDKLIQKYSEDAIDKEPPFEMYYKKGELLSELETALDNLKSNEISKPIKTKYAYHIIQKLELDNFKLNDYYVDLREEKCINDLKEYLDDLKIIYHEAYKKIEVK